ncbi:MAG: ATP-dependent helicase, partial [Acidimicrobiales bacterium]|nr:ATP-dependent helicase [Acidimicrobiales bacterium]
GWDRPTGADPDLLARLRSWREGVARASRVLPSVVLSDRTLAAVATTRPAGPADLTDLPGLGPLGASRYGSTLLEIVADHAATRPADAPAAATGGAAATTDVEAVDRGDQAR